MISRDNGDGVYLFLTGAEAAKSNLPFLLDGEMRPITPANAWLRRVSQDGATSSTYTHRTYAYALFDFLSYLARRKIHWRDVTNDTLIQYRDVQDENNSPHTKAPLNRKTINARISTVERFYAFAAANNFIDKNPVTYKTIKSRRPADADLLAHLGGERELSVPLAAYERLPTSKIKWRSHSDVMAWINSIRVWRDKLLSRLLYRTGMRRSEVITLKVAGLPKRATVDTTRPEVPVEILGKGRKTRVIYLAARDLLDLYDYIKIVRAPLAKKAGVNHDFVFVSRSGQPLRPGYVNQIFKRVSEACCISITPHMMRHSFAVSALQHWKRIGFSRPEKLLQARLGHASQTTTEIYTHMTDEMLAEEALANASLIEHLLRGGDDETE